MNMKSINAVILVILLICTSVFVLSSTIAGWFERDNGQTFALIPYVISFYIGLFVSLMGIPLALIGIVWCKRDVRTALVSTVLLLASTAFVIFLVVWPILAHHNMLN